MEMEFGEVDGDEDLVVVVLSKETCIPNWENQAGNISVANISFLQRSKNIGLVPSPDPSLLSYSHVPVCLSFNKQIYANILKGPVVLVLPDKPFQQDLARILLLNTCKLSPLILNKDLSSIPIYAAVKKHYKTVHRRTAPVPIILPEKFCVTCHFPFDSCELLPMRIPFPLPFISTGQYTKAYNKSALIAWYQIEED
ncbi:hypothetical protein BT96DRAFT_1007706 [Gymnopus androsaceus JB14]|uniref:Uncharacterized protein n=1 Tax=Gymnopus androsaceus JB14 TaxID=1447944 RepID=A0A6A4GGQ7_9AGAR|nr:hypothetical protein BT96DRAFT_1007706 [Gymnopus androsaceus JB14]